ncbi:caspase-7-like [Liolophura sinensis]|uniref:caspase-7-like n=1 Tax=Liolophura sinensis TaxID=3198878 RepID=UPI0031593E45
MMDDSKPGDDIDARRQGDGAPDDGPDAGPTRRFIGSPMEMGESGFSPADAYRMDYPERGYALIINNRKFASHLRMPERHGTDVDAAGLYQVFTDLQFKVDLKHNMSKKDLLDYLKEVYTCSSLISAAVDHSRFDCFACAILTHGEEGIIYATDGTIPITDIVEPFKGHNCRSLIGKPKLFFIQACRGTRLDHGVEKSDGAGEETMDEVDAATVHRIPSEADFLMAYSVVPGFFSWRNSTNGSWFCQALIQMLKQHGKTMDLLSVMTRVNRKVAYEFESNAAKAHMTNKKQIPCITSMLTKDLYLRPKSSLPPNRMEPVHEYCMDHASRGLAVIINNRHFQHPDWGERRGTDVDAVKMRQVLTNLGFEVRLYQNETEEGFREILAEAVQYDHHNSDCFACVVLSHGESGYVYATDEIIPLSSIFEPFTEKNCPGLRGKPKLFFIQACQGKQLDDGVDFVDDRDSVDSALETDAPIGEGIAVVPDFLVVSSSVPGYYSWRNNVRGSWFCQSFCDVISRLGDRMDLLRLLTRVSRKVAYDFQSVSHSVPEIHAKKQIPCVISMLTKDLYFRPKR